MELLDKTKTYVLGLYQMTTASWLAQDWQDSAIVESKERWTHVGVLCYRELKWRVIEAIPSGTRQEQYPCNLSAFVNVRTVQAFPMDLDIGAAKKLVGTPFPMGKLQEALETYAFSGVKWEPESYSDMTCGKVLEHAGAPKTKHCWPVEYQELGLQAGTIQTIIWREGDLWAL